MSVCKTGPGYRTQVRLLAASYNIHCCVGMDGCRDVSRIAEVIRETGAQIVGLQEVISHSDNEVSQMTHLAELTGFSAIPGPTIYREDSHYGNIVLTRWPVLHVRRMSLNVSRREPRGAVDILLDVMGHQVRVITTHLGLKRAERLRQVRKLLEFLEEPVGDCVVLLGDINEWAPWRLSLRSLHQHFGKIPHLATFPTPCPILALDRIWVKPRMALEELRVHDSDLARSASDHLPVVAEIVMGQALNSDSSTVDCDPAIP